ncbi:hypothetical protein AZH53_03740 [Methanomicrobiaceae archaeon CYW5]|uniref:hypothetical protein n=1 Tax=Methanovulcanius yangii TaxID=1789227 RepID=UPI0029CA7E33|nr:hypothetical protein [Methanovulcanius yangii]MBT8507534.1 hypothetical protein [Methanovulcanius yangii]
MLIENIFGTEDIGCIEPTFANLTEDYYTAELLELEAEEGRLLINENDHPIAFAVRAKGAWTAASFVCRPCSPAVFDRMEELGGDVYQEPQQEYMRALMEYYNVRLCGHVRPAPEDNRPGRQEMIVSLLREVWNDDMDGRSCIDCCCGSGVVSAALRDCGAYPVAYDNDPELIALGLVTGRLLPEQTMHIDATVAGEYIGPAELGAGLMLGDITSFNSEMWQQIVWELLYLSKRTLMSTATEPEIRLIGEWCEEMGRPCEIFAHDADPIYDAWVCVAE